MRKIIDEWVVGNKYTILTLDEDLPHQAIWHYVIDGVEYDPVIVYDMGKSIIGIEKVAADSFIGKTVEFK